MTYTIPHVGITGRIVGRSEIRDRTGRRCYLLHEPVTGNLYAVSGGLLREAK